MPLHRPVMSVAGRQRAAFNLWDVLAFGLLLAGAILILQEGRSTMAPLSTLSQHPVSLDPANLPGYALRTTARMLAAMAASVVFTFVYAPIAAKSRRAEMVLVPLLDILQSVPVLGFLSFTVTGFMALFPGRVMGAELASVFAIFTSQAWNMTFSFHQSLKTVPAELDELARSFRLTAWQRFWRLEVPFSLPGLVWNAMVSMSGGWFFVVASEAISVGHTTVVLPGIGSWLALAIAQRDLAAVGWAVAAMLTIILAYDLLVFRPLVGWSGKFRVELSAGEPPPRSWLLVMVRRTRLLSVLLGPLSAMMDRLPARRLQWPAACRLTFPRMDRRFADRAWTALLAAMAFYAAWHIGRFVLANIGIAELGKAMGLGLITLIRVVVLTALASLVWVPVGVWIGLRPGVAARVQPLAQFLAAFPANIVFPFVVAAIVRWHLAPDVWLSPLMVLGTQWYILFNVIAGASAFPTDLKDAVASFHIGGWNWWRNVILPAIFPYYVTGAITASGGSWNASIVAEVASWGDTTVTAHGLGAYIATATAAGDTPRIVLGVAVMSGFVVLLNRLVWHPLSAFANRRLRMD